MKHLNHMHGQIRTGAYVAPASVAAIAMEGIALEGIGDEVKAKWNLLKSKFSPSDETKAKAQIEVFEKLKKDAAEVKQHVSSAADIKQATLKLTAAAKNLPVDANSADELIRNLSAWRKKMASEISRVSKITDKAEADKAIAQVKQEMGAKGKIADNLVFTKQHLLKLLDENMAILDLAIAVCNLSLKNKAEAASTKPSMESLNLAMESLDLSVAMEGFWTKFFGAYLIYGAYGAYFGAVVYAIIAICALACGAWIGALGAAAGAGVSWFVGNLYMRWGKTLWESGDEEER